MYILCTLFHSNYRVTLVVFTLFPVLQLHPVRSGKTLHSSPSKHGCIWHHHFWITMEASTHDGAARVVPATCPGKQEHFTVCDLSSILFLLQHLWAAMTSHVPGSTWTECTLWCVDAEVSRPHSVIRQRVSTSTHLLKLWMSLSLILLFGFHSYCLSIRKSQRRCALAENSRHWCIWCLPFIAGSTKKDSYNHIAK